MKHQIMMVCVIASMLAFSGVQAAIVCILACIVGSVLSDIYEAIRK